MDALGVGKDNHFRMLATAIAGRPIEVVPSSQSLSWCDGENIHLAAEDGSHTVVVQAALVAAGSLEAEEILFVVGRQRLQRRYFMLEVVRALQAIRDIAPPRLAEAVSPFLLTDEVSKSPQESLARARGREILPAAANWFGVIKPAFLVAHSARIKQHKGQQSTTIDKRSALASVDSTEAKANKSLQRKDNKAAGMGNPLANLLRWMLGSSGSGNSDSSGGVEIQGSVSRASSQQLRAESQLRGEMHTGDEHILAPAANDHAYPEWDSRSGTYRQRWTLVRERGVSVAKSTTPLEVKEDSYLRRALSGLGLAHERHGRQPEGDNLDLTALIEHAVNRVSGVEFDARVYEKRYRTAHDLSALVLLDATGSTADENHRSSIFDAQCQVVARLLSVLDELGDRVAGYAFRAWGRHNVGLLELKNFEDRFNVTTRRRLAALSPAGYSRIGAAIRHASEVLASRGGTTNRLLVVVSDGLPYDDGYEGVYAQEDVRKALAEAVDKGVGCACVTIGSGTDNKVLSRAWGSVPYLRIASVEELHKVVLPIFRSGLSQAALLGRDGRQNGVTTGNHSA